MTSITPNITSSVSLSISVSGTANLRKMLAAAKPGVANPTADVSPSANAPGGTPSAAAELAKASDATRDAILHALQLYNPNATLTGYKDGEKFTNAEGQSINLIA